MFNETYQKPMLRTILIAGIMFGLLLALMWSLSPVVKLMGAPFLYLPAKVGLIQQATSEEIHTMDRATHSSVVAITKPGHYAVFTDDRALLDISNGGVEQHLQPWLSLTSRVTGQPIPVTWVDRGLRPYDTALVPGRPVLTFDIVRAGNYTFTDAQATTTSTATFAIVPDYTTGKETTLLVAYVLQLLLISILLHFLFQWFPRHGRSTRKRTAVLEQQRLAQNTAFWEKEMLQLKAPLPKKK